MSEAQETLADIRKDAEEKLRAELKKMFARPPDPLRVLQAFNDMFDRIEAAHRREIDKLNAVIQAQRSQFDAEIDRLRREKSPGNMAKMREALELFAHMNDDGYYDDIPVIKNIVEKAKCALAKPPRNCDVGSAEEQTRRFVVYCARHRHTDLPKCAGCRLESLPSGTGCEEAWAQMPYEANESEAR